MAIDSDYRREVFFSNGVALIYPFAFKIFSAANISVIEKDLAGNDTLLTLSLEYSVTLNPDQDLAPGGAVTLLAALPIGHQLTLISAVPFTQLIKLTNQGGFYPEVINDGFDKLTILIQQVKDGIDNAIPDTNVIRTQEKQAMALGWALIQAEYAYMITNSTLLSVSTTDFSQDFQDLSDFLTPVLLDLNTPSLVSRSLYNTLVQAYYIARALHTSTLMTALQNAGAPAGSFVAGLLAETLVSNVAANTAKFVELNTYTTIIPAKKDLLKPLWDLVAKEREDLVAAATALSIDLTAFNAAYAAVYAIAFDLFGLNSGNHYAYANRNVTTIGFDFDAYKAALVAFRSAATTLQTAITVKRFPVGVASGAGSTTVTMTLTTKPGASTATNTWIEVFVGTKKYWVAAWEDVNV